MACPNSSRHFIMSSRKTNSEKKEDGAKSLKAGFGFRSGTKKFRRHCPFKRQRSQKSNQNHSANSAGESIPSESILSTDVEMDTILTHDITTCPADVPDFAPYVAETSKPLKVKTVFLLYVKTMIYEYIGVSYHLQGGYCGVILVCLPHIVFAFALCLPFCPNLFIRPVFTKY